MKKSDTWPNKAESDLGMRYLNPCEEIDYGNHIFEDPETGYLVATSTAGFYHIVNMGLNDSHFVDNRKERTEFLMRLEADFLILDNSKADPEEVESAKRIFDTITQAVENSIPKIAPPPQGVVLYKTH